MKRYSGTECFTKKKLCKAKLPLITDNMSKVKLKEVWAYLDR